MKTNLLISTILAIVTLTSCAGSKNDTTEQTQGVKIYAQHITNAEFKSKVFDYTLNNTWKFEGDKPAIVDFYATWCGPCKMLSPLLEELAKKYDGKLNVYKIDVDQEKELAAKMGISNLPTLVFIPTNDKPQISEGYLPKESLEKVINEVLKVK